MCLVGRASTPGGDWVSVLHLQRGSSGISRRRYESHSVYTVYVNSEFHPFHLCRHLRAGCFKGCKLLSMMGTHSPPNIRCLWCRLNTVDAIESGSKSLAVAPDSEKRYHSIRRWTILPRDRGIILQAYYQKCTCSWKPAPSYCGQWLAWTHSCPLPLQLRTAAMYPYLIYSFLCFHSDSASGWWQSSYKHRKYITAWAAEWQQWQFMTCYEFLSRQGTTSVRSIGGL